MGGSGDAAESATANPIRMRANTKGTSAARKKIRKRQSHQAGAHKSGNPYLPGDDHGHGAGHEAEGHHSAHQVSFYAKPHQPKHWGDPDPEHHFDSFALFFDLIFVGGAYAAGNLLKSGLSVHGILMFAAVMLVMRDTWNIKVLRDGRFHFDSAFHSLLDMFHLVLVMLLVLQVEVYPRMQNAGKGGALGFSIVSLLIRLMEFARNVEISKTAETVNGKRTWKTMAASDSVGIVSFSIAIWYAATYDDLTLIWIPWMAGPVLAPIVYLKLMGRSKRRGTFQRDFVPLNLTFLIHRNAEWSMLMLGESIFSLLIVPVEHTFDFTVVFILGTMITANVYYHHFELYEEIPKYHAMSLSARKGLLFSESRSLLSVSLVAMGVSFKIMLLNVEEPYLKQKYINVFAIPFAITLLLSDFTALLHNNGTSGIFEYFRIIFGSLHHPIGRNLALVWLGKFTIYGVSLALPTMTLTSMELAGIGCGLSFVASLLVVWQSEPATDITVLKQERMSLVSELERRQQRAGAGRTSTTETTAQSGDSSRVAAVAEASLTNPNYLEVGSEDESGDAAASGGGSAALAPSIVNEAAGAEGIYSEGASDSAVDKAIASANLGSAVQTGDQEGPREARSDPVLAI